jgi:hypothetical protein
LILPTKGLAPDRALLSIGADALRGLHRPKTVSKLCAYVKANQGALTQGLTYDWFVLALDVLFMWGAVTFDDGQLRRAKPQRKP